MPEVTGLADLVLSLGGAHAQVFEGPPAIYVTRPVAAVVITRTLPDGYGHALHKSVLNCDFDLWLFHIAVHVGVPRHR